MVQAIKRDEVFIEPEGIHVETHQPERRSRKPPLLLVHGALTGSWIWTEFAAFLAERGWEAHAMNFRGHFTSDVAELDDVTMRDYADDIGVAMRQLARPAVVIGWGIGALAALMYAERNPVLGLVLLAPSPPADALPRRPEEHELRAGPDSRAPWSSSLILSRSSSSMSGMRSRSSSREPVRPHQSAS